MSRSRKRTPCFVSEGHKHIHWAKRQANKKVRSSKNVPNGKAYRKLYCTWNIRDWKWVLHNNIEIEDFLKKDLYERYEIYMK